MKTSIKKTKKTAPRIDSPKTGADAAPRTELIIKESPEEAARAAAVLFILTAQSAISDKGSFTVALSGGNTPEGLYRLLASGSFRDKLDWGKVHFFWGDERCTGPADEASNFRMAYTALLGPLCVKEDRMHRIKGEFGQAAAPEYEQELKKAFKLSPGEMPYFDLILLGLGADGHTASLFPGSPLLGASSGIAAYVEPGGGKVARITLTLRAINNSKRVIFLVTGADKSKALSGCMEGGEKMLPARLVRPISGKLTWIADKAAASALKT